jgi:hypothetical protein
MYIGKQMNFLMDAKLINNHKEIKCNVGIILSAIDCIPSQENAFTSLWIKIICIVTSF